MNTQLILLKTIIAREFVGNLLWVVFFLFALIGLKYKRFRFIGGCLALLFASIFVHEADILKVGKEGITFFRRAIPKDHKIEEPQKPIDVYLTQEYPTYPEYSYRDSIDLRTNPAIIKWQKGEHRFWIGIGNMGRHNFSNPTIFLDFKGKVNIRVDSSSSRGWIETDPDFTYVNNIKGDLQPDMGFRLNPLYVTFPEEGTYSVSYSITGDNYPSVKGTFNIEVKK